MKIALALSHFADRGAGGPGRNASDLARGLLDRGHEVHVISHRLESADSSRLRWHPVALSSVHILRPWSFARNVERVLERERFDIVHSFTRIFRCDVYFVGGGIHREYLRGIHHGRPWAAALARVNPRHWIANYVERRSFDPTHCRIFAVLAERTRDEVLRHYRVPPDAIRLVRLGVDLERFSSRLRAERRAAARAELGLGAEDLAMLFVGSGWTRKGLRYAIEALPAAPRWRLFVCGRGPARAYGAVASKLGAAERVAFLGARDDVDRLHAAVDALVLPSLQDPFPNVCLEAMASGLPVITTRVTGISEIVRQGVNGLILEHGSDVPALAEGLNRLADRSVREEVGRRARTTAESFSIDHYVEEYLKLYRELAPGAGRSGT